MIPELERILLARFPTIVLKDSYTRTSYPGRRFVDAFFVPDEQIAEFMAFTIDEWPVLREAVGLGDVHVHPFSVTATRRDHPEIAPRRVRSARPAASARRRRAKVTPAARG